MAGSGAGRLGLGAKLLDGLREEIGGAGTWDEQLLACLRDARGQAHVAIVSNAWPHLRRRLVDERVDQIVDEVILSCEVSCAKPDSRIYRLALGRLALGRLRGTPERALFIDDTAAHVVAAISVGLRGHVHINRISSLAAIEQFLGGDRPRHN